MKLSKVLICIAVFMFAHASIHAQEVSPQLITKSWRAYWVTAPNAPAHGYGVYHFRKELTLDKAPDKYLIHVSADNRYRLYVNEHLVSLGPARGDLDHWNFETVDIAPYLISGKNIIASTVWNDGDLRAVAQISNETAFIVQGDTPDEYGINTNGSWLCCRDNGYSPLKQYVIGYYAASPGEIVDMNNTVRGWMDQNYDDKSWHRVMSIGVGNYKGASSLIQLPWMLVASSIPQMELTYQRLRSTRLASGISVPASFPAEKKEITIPAHKNVVLLLDQSYLTDAYPTLIYSKGKGATVAIKYAEALYTPGTMEKGNRNDIKGKIMIGRCDSVICNGQDNQEYTPLYWRTYRYVQLSVHTTDEPLIINDFYGTFTGYPFKNNTTFVCDNPLLPKMLEIGWRTARSCATETYMDCPYYEQLQYIGDTRIQAMVSYYNSGDDRLARNAINLLDNSRLAEGITMERYPSSETGIIPPFSLMWVGMLSDYYNYRPDTDFVRSHLPGCRQILSFFEKYEGADGSMKNPPYWNFIDWAVNAPKWKSGAPPLGSDGSSSVLDLLLLRSYQLSSVMERNLGVAGMADYYDHYAELLKQTIVKKYWDADKKMFADNIDKDSYSQHANVWAILTGVVSGDDAKSLLERIMNDKDIAQSSIYFLYYLNQAMFKVGLGNDYLNHLDIWKKNIDLGMTTWGEDSNVEGTRSDCHAWSASPNIEFFRSVLGIDSDAPGFSKVKIEPHLSALKKLSGSIPHPYGKISVSYIFNKKDNKWKISITLPEKLTGTFVWNDKGYSLKSGLNAFDI